MGRLTLVLFITVALVVAPVSATTGGVGPGGGDGHTADSSTETVDRVASEPTREAAMTDARTGQTASNATGEVVGDQPTGGLVGENHYIVRRSYATGAVTSGDAETGGLVGTLETVSNYDDTEVAVIEESFATGDVDGSTKAGGLVGQNNYGNVTASYARGDVEGDDRVAGLVGANNEGAGAGFVMDSYATGNVTGNRFVEGLVYNNGGVVVESYFTEGSVDGDLTPLEEQRVLGATDMRGSSAAENMGGFDFGNTWATVDGDYPQLQWYSEQQQADSDTNGGDSDESTSGDDVTTGASGPGMGVSVAVMSLLAAALLLARRNQD